MKSSFFGDSFLAIVLWQSLMPDAPSAPSSVPDFDAPLRVRLDRVRLDAGTQSRLGGHDPSTVHRYAEEMQAGLWEFERSPLPLLFFDGEYYYPGDGHHRIQAALNSGLTELLCDVKPGSRREAQFYSNTEANKYHGKQLTRQDKRNRVQNLLLDQEWALMSDREIARYCGVSAPFVGGIRKNLVADEQISGDRKRKGKDGKIRDTTKIGRIKPNPPEQSERQSDSQPYTEVLQERNALMNRITVQQEQHQREIQRLTAESLLGRNEELEQALVDDEMLMQQIYDGLGTIRAALDPDRPAKELRQDVQRAARGIDLMRQILASQAPNVVQDNGVEE